MRSIACFDFHLLCNVLLFCGKLATENQVCKIFEKISSRESPKKGLIMDFNLTEKTFTSLIYDKKIQLNSKKAPDRSIE